MGTFVLVVELPVPKYQTFNYHLGVAQQDFMSVIELYRRWLLGPALAAVQTVKADLGFDIPVDSEGSPLEEVAGYRRVVADLLHINWTPSDHALHRFSQNWVEGLLAANAQVGH